MFDDFSMLVREADQWAHSVPDLRILNYQTLTCKVKLTKSKCGYRDTHCKRNGCELQSQNSACNEWQQAGIVTPDNVAL